MMATLEWRQRFTHADRYPMEVAGVPMKFRQLQSGELTGLGTGATVSESNACSA